MDETILRPFEPGDIAAVAAIYRDAVLNGAASYELEAPTEEEMAARFAALGAAGYPRLVAERGGRVLGYAYAGAFRPRPAYRFVVEDSVYVDPAAKGMGLGATLLAALIEAVTAKGYRQIIAVIGDGGEANPSVRLHRKFGFRLAGQLEGTGFKHGRWLDTVMMQLPINGGRAAPPDPASWPERRFREG